MSTHQSHAYTDTPAAAMPMSPPQLPQVFDMATPSGSQGSQMPHLPSFSGMGASAATAPASPQGTGSAAASRAADTPVPEEPPVPGAASQASTQPDAPGEPMYVPPPALPWDTRQSMANVETSFAAGRSVQPSGSLARPDAQVSVVPLLGGFGQLAALRESRQQARASSLTLRPVSNPWECLTGNPQGSARRSDPRATLSRYDAETGRRSRLNFCT